MTGEFTDRDVIIAGGGPVGLTLAMDLASRGRSVTVIELRAPGEPPSVKCNHVSARTMEIFRRLGVADAVRGAGLPADYPNDVSYRTSTTGVEIARIRIPCRRDRYSDTDGPDGWWPTPEPPHRINQIYLEPILFEAAGAMPGIRILNRTEMLDFEQDEAGVTVRVRDSAHRSDGAARLSFNVDLAETAAALDSEAPEIVAQPDRRATRTLRARFLIGCDGGRSRVRRAIGSRLLGDAVVQRVQSTLIRAPGLLAILRTAPAWAMFSLNPRRSGNVYAIDGREIFLVHNYLREDEADFDSIDRDDSIRTILGRHRRKNH